MVRALYVLDDLFGYDVRADVSMLGEEDDDLVARDSDPHICTACISHCERNELTHHQVQVKS